MNKRRMIGVFIFLAVGIMGAVGIFFVLNKGKTPTDIFANMGISAPTAVALEMEVEKNNDPAASSKFTPVGANRTKTFNVNVSGLPKTASTMIYANSLSPEIADARVVAGPDENGNSTVSVTAKNGGTARIKITSASGARVVYVAVDVKLEAKGILFNQGVHTAIVQKSDGTAVLTFDEAKFTYLAHPEDINRIYKANTHTAAYTWSPLNETTYDAVRVVNNTLEVDADRTLDGTEVWVRSTITKSGEFADFPVHIFRPFTSVKAVREYDPNNLEPTTETDESADPNDGGIYAEYGQFSALDLIHNRADKEEDKIKATYAFDMPGWDENDGGIDKYYGIMAHSENSMIVTSETVPSASGAYRFDGNNLLGKTTLNVIAYPIAEMSILRGTGFVKENTAFNWGDDTVVQKKVRITAYNRNEFRREDEPEEDGKLFFERDGDPLYYENRDINKNGIQDNGEKWFDSRDTNRNGRWDEDGGEDFFDPNNSDGARLVPDNGQVLYVFSYPSAAEFPEKYYTEFKIGAVEININAIDEVISNDVVFELWARAKGSANATVYTGSMLNTYLDIRANGVPMSQPQIDYHAPYGSVFTMALKQPGAGLVSPDTQLWLRVKSYNPLSDGAYSDLGDANGNEVVDNDYAIAEIGLSATNAIDDFFIKKLPELPTGNHDIAGANNMDTIPLIVPDDDPDDLYDDFSENITPEFIVYGSSYVNYGNPNTDWELDAEKVKIETFGAPIKALNSGRQVKVGKVQGKNNAGYGYYTPGGAKYVSDIYTTFDTNGNGLEDNGENWNWTHIRSDASGREDVFGPPAAYDQPNNVISDFIGGENRRTNLVEYTFAVDLTKPYALYTEYPVRFTYPNGVYHEIKVVIYPYVNTMTMSVNSSGGGSVFQSYKIDGMDISRTDSENPESARQNMDAPDKDKQPFHHAVENLITGEMEFAENDNSLYTSAAYVRLGANYRLSLNTLTKDRKPAEVGAVATFSEMRVSADGSTFKDYPYGNGKSTFEALHEGEYEARVTLTAANDDVFRRFTYQVGETNDKPGFQKEPVEIIGRDDNLDGENDMVADAWTWNGFRRSWYIRFTVVNPIISAEFTGNNLELTAARTLGQSDIIGKAEQEIGMGMVFAYPAEEEYGTMNRVFLGHPLMEDAVQIGGLNDAANKIVDANNPNRAESRFVVTGQYETDTTAQIPFTLWQEYRSVGRKLPTWTLEYLSGQSSQNNNMTLNVDVIYGNPVEEVTIVNGPYSSNAVSTDGTYIGLYYQPGVAPTDILIGAQVFPALADNSQIGFAFAEWDVKGNKWELGYSQNRQGVYEVGYSILNDGGAVNNKRDGNPRIAEIVGLDIPNKLVTLRARGFNDDAVYDTQIGLVAYAYDSMRRVSVNVDGNVITYDRPLTYSVIPVFVAPTNRDFGEIADSFFGLVHDANSGVKNDRGGYNWVIAAEDVASTTTIDEGAQNAVLFFTTSRVGSAPIQSTIKANKYYIDDLHTVLGWPGLNTESTSAYPQAGGFDKNLLKIINNPVTPDCAEMTYYGEDRLFLTVKGMGAFELRYDPDGANRFIGNFTVVQGLSTVNISTGGKGKLARHTLDSTLQGTSYEYDRGFTARRGSQFILNADWPANSNWSATIYGKKYGTAILQDGSKDYEKTPTFPAAGSPPLYTGSPINTADREPLDTNRDLFVIPFIKDPAGLTYRMPELQAVIPVTLIKGAKYLEVSQQESTIDGHTAAIYDVTMITDEMTWRNELLLYTFTYTAPGSSEPVTVSLFPKTGPMGPDATKVPLRDSESIETGAYLVFTLTRNEAVRLDPANDPEGLVFYKYRISIKISLVVDGTATNPIFTITNGLLKVKESVSKVDAAFHTALEAEAALNVTDEYVYNVQFEHFANVTAVGISGLRMDEAQSGNREIYLDSGGGLLKVFTTPYYVGVDSFEISSKAFQNPVVVGYDKDESPIYKYETWRIHFIQYVYDAANRQYIQYRPEDGKPGIRMLSTWLGGDDYGWDGVYYFKTVVQQEFQGKASGLPPVGTRFDVTATITTDGRVATQPTVLTVAHPAGVDVGDGGMTDPDPLATIIVDAHQAIGTTKSYSIILPAGADAHYEDIAVSGASEAFFAYTLDGSLLTLTIHPTESILNSVLSFRVPYGQSGGFAIQYYLLKVTPVLFELGKIYIKNSPENPLLVNSAVPTAIELKVEAVRADSAAPALTTQIDNAIRRFEDDLNYNNDVTWHGVNGHTGEYRSFLGNQGWSLYSDLVFIFKDEMGAKSIKANSINIEAREGLSSSPVTWNHLRAGSYLRVMIPFSYTDGVPLIELEGRYMMETDKWVLDVEDWIRTYKRPLSEEEYMLAGPYGNGEYDVTMDGRIVANADSVPGTVLTEYDENAPIEFYGAKALTVKENMAVGTENSFRVDKTDGNGMDFYNATAYWYSYDGNNKMVPENPDRAEADNGIITLAYSVPGEAGVVTTSTIIYDPKEGKAKVTLDINAPLDKIMRVEIPYTEAPNGGNLVTRIFKLDVVPVLFTFDEYSLQDWSDDPKTLLFGWPKQVILELRADDITRAPESVANAGLNAVRYSAINGAISNFNASLKKEYGELPIEYFAYRDYSRTVLLNDGKIDNSLNFKFYAAEDGKVYVEKSKDIDATSWFGVSTKVEYINGVPALTDRYNANGLTNAPSELNPDWDGPGTDWQDTTGNFVTTVSYSWQMKTEAASPHPPEIPKGYTVRFGIMVEKGGTTDPITGIPISASKQIVWGDDDDWGYYTGTDPIFMQRLPYGERPTLPQKDPTYWLNRDDDPENDYIFMGWYPSQYWYVYGTMADQTWSKTKLTGDELDEAGDLLGQVLHPVEPALPVASALRSSDYLRSRYQISQDTVFIAYFKLASWPAGAEWPVAYPYDEDNPPDGWPADVPWPMDPDYPSSSPDWWPDLEIPDTMPPWWPQPDGPPWPWPPGGEWPGDPPPGWPYPPYPPGTPWPPPTLDEDTEGPGEENYTVRFFSQDENGVDILVDEQTVQAGGFVNPVPTDLTWGALQLTGWWFVSGYFAPEYWIPESRTPLSFAALAERPITSNMDFYPDFNGVLIGGPGPMHTVNFMTYHPDPDKAEKGATAAIIGPDGKPIKAYVVNGGSLKQYPVNDPTYSPYTFTGWELSEGDGSDWETVIETNPDMTADTVLQFVSTDETNLANKILGYYVGEEFRPLIIINDYAMDIYLSAHFEYQPIVAGKRVDAIALGTRREYPVGGEPVNVDIMFVRYTKNGETIDLDGTTEGNMKKFNFGSAYAFSLSWEGTITSLAVEMSTNTGILGGIIEIFLPFAAMRNGTENDRLNYCIQLIPVWFTVEQIIAVNNDTGSEYILDPGENLIDWYSEHRQLKLSAVIRSYKDYVQDGAIPEDYVMHDVESLINSAMIQFERNINALNQTVTGTDTIRIVSGDSVEGIKLGYDEPGYDGVATVGQNTIWRTVPEEYRATLQILANVKYGDDGLPVIVKADASDPSVVQLSPKFYNLVTRDRTDDMGESPEHPFLIWKSNAADLKIMTPGRHYMLMEDIDLITDTQMDNEGWQPIALGGEEGEYTTFDGNNFKIFIRNNTFHTLPTDGVNAENIGMFSVINPGAVVKNLQLVVYDEEAGMNGVSEVAFDLTGLTAEVKGGVKLGLLAGTNKGTITNCAILSGAQFKNAGNDNPNQILGGIHGASVGNDAARARDLKAEYDRSAFFIPDPLNRPFEGQARGRMVVKTNNEKVDIFVGGLVGSNEGSITNSRVLIDVELSGPELIEHPTVVDAWIEVPNAKTAVVGGIAGKNTKLITATFLSDANVINQALPAANGTGAVGGFVGQNLSGGRIMASYVMGISTGRNASNNHVKPGAVVWSDRVEVGAFVHQNGGTITDCLSNVVLKKMGAGEVAGFVFTNTGTITNCIANNDFIRDDKVGSQAYAYEFVKTNGSATQIVNSIYFRNNSNMHPGDAKKNIDTIDPAGFVNAGFPASQKLSIYNVDESIYESYSMDGTITNPDADKGIGASFNEINTIWRLTPTGPIPNSARYEIVYSMLRTNGEKNDPNPPELTDMDGYAEAGARDNPLLVNSEDEYTKYLTGKNFAQAGSIEGTHVSSKNIRLINDITFASTPMTYNLIYQNGTFDGNGFTLNNVSNVRTESSAAMSSTGLFAKTEGVKFKNLNIRIARQGTSANAAIDAQSYNYVGGLTGIAVNTDLIDISVASATATDTIVGGHIVGGLAGIMIATQPTVRIFNVNAQTALWSTWHSGAYVTPDDPFSTGREYYEGKNGNTRSELRMSNGMRTGTYVFDKTYYDKLPNGEAIGMSVVGNLFGILTSVPRYSRVETEMFGQLYFNESKTPTYKEIRVQNVTGSALSLRGDIAGGLIGVMDRKTLVDSAAINGLGSVTGKYYLGGMVGINLGTIQNSDMNARAFNAASDAAGASRYVFQNKLDMKDTSSPGTYWGMTIGGIAGYNNGTIDKVKTFAQVGGRNAADIYVVGGIVGQNDTTALEAGSTSAIAIDRRGVVNDCTNNNNTEINVGQVGFYFGNLIGRVADTVNSNNTVAVWEAPILGTKVTSRHFYEATMPGANGTTAYPLLMAAAARHHNGEITVTGGVDGAAFSSNIDKIQTYTLEEYLQYVYRGKGSWTIAEIAEKLEPLVRGLPREKVAGATHYGEAVYKFSEYPEAEKAREKYPNLGNAELDLEKFDLAEMKKWLQESDILREYKNQQGVPYAGYELARYNAYMHYLDDNMYMHYTTQVKNDSYTGYIIGADYGTGAISLEEYIQFAAEVYKDNTTRPANNLIFTMEDYIEYLKYKLAKGIDYDGNQLDPITKLPVTMKDEAGKETPLKTGLSLEDYIEWDRRDGFYKGRKVGGDNNIDWYWPISANTLYYGYEKVGDAWYMRAGEWSKMSSILAATAQDGNSGWIRGTGFNNLSGEGSDIWKTEARHKGQISNKIVNNAGQDITVAEGETPREHVHDYFGFLQAQVTAGSNLTGYFKGSDNAPNDVDFYAAWLYDDMSMTLDEYIAYLKSSTYTLEELAYLRAFGVNAEDLKDLKLSFAQFKTLTEYESAALGYDLRWYYSGQDTPIASNPPMPARGVGVDEVTIRDKYFPGVSGAELVDNTVYLYFVDRNDANLFPVSGTLPLTAKAVNGYTWMEHTDSGSSIKTRWFYTAGGQKYPMFHELYLNTMTAVPSTSTDPKVRITFEEYLRIYSTQSNDGLVDLNSDKTFPIKGDPLYNKAYAETGAGKDVITATEDYIRLKNFGKYNKTSTVVAIASLWDYHNAGGGTVSSVGVVGENTSPVDFAKYLFGISTYQYGWSAVTSNYIYDNFDKSLEWGVVGTFKSVLEPANAYSTIKVPAGIIAETAFNDGISARQSTTVNGALLTGNNYAWPDFSYKVTDKKTGVFKNGGRRNDIRSAALYMESYQDDQFTPNAFAQPSSYKAPGTLDTITLNNMTTSGVDNMNVLEWAYLWKQKGFSPAQFEEMKNRVIFADNPYLNKRRVSTNLAGNVSEGQSNQNLWKDNWTWGLLLSDYFKFTNVFVNGGAGVLDPYEYVDILRNNGSYSEYEQFTNGTDGLNADTDGWNRQYISNGAAEYKIEVSDTSQTSVQEVITIAGVAVTNNTTTEPAESDETTVIYGNPLSGIPAPTAYLYMIGNGGHTDDFMIKMGRKHVAAWTPPGPITEDVTGKSFFGNVANPGGGTFNMDKYFLSDVNRGPNPLSLDDLKRYGDSVWVGLVAGASGSYTFELTGNYNTWYGYGSHIWYNFYPINSEGKTSTAVASGAQVVNNATPLSITVSLNANTRYLAKFSLNCNLAGHNTANGIKLSVSGNNHLINPGEIVGTKTTTTTITGENQEYVGIFPALPFYVDYMRRQQEAGVGNFISGTEYMDALNVYNFDFVFDQYADESKDVPTTATVATADTDETTGTTTPPAAGNSSGSNADAMADLHSKLGWTPTVDALVNWVMFNKRNANSENNTTENGTPTGEYKRGLFTTKTGNNTDTLISFYDYADWLLNYANNDDYQADRETWLTFEAFCVWKRMEVWDKYKRADLTAMESHSFSKQKIDEDGNPELDEDGNPVYESVETEGWPSAVALQSVNKTRFGIVNGFEPLPNVGRRGIYVYCACSADGNCYHDPYTDLAGGYKFSKLLPWDNPATETENENYSGLKSIFESNGNTAPSPNGRVYPYGNSIYESLHIEYDSKGASFFYGSKVVKEQEKKTEDDGNNLLITYVNPSYDGFKSAAESLWKALCMFDPYSGVVTDTSGYDKYMYYWATHSDPLGAVLDGNDVPVNQATVPTGSDSFWKSAYATDSFYFHDGEDFVWADDQARKYTPLLQRLEPSEENQGTGRNDDGEPIVVAHW